MSERYDAQAVEAKWQAVRVHTSVMPIVSQGGGVDKRSLVWTNGAWSFVALTID